MIKSQLIQKIATANPHLLRQDAERVVNVILDQIVDALAAGRRVELRGFGAFTTKFRPPRKARNPRTGKPVFVPEKYTPAFKTGKELKERLNPAFAAAKTKPRKASRTKTAAKRVRKR